MVFRAEIRSRASYSKPVQSHMSYIRCPYLSYASPHLSFAAPCLSYVTAYLSYAAPYLRYAAP